MLNDINDINDIEVAYILLRFPFFTETFIAEEVHKIQSLGIKTRIFSLLSTKGGIIHPVSEQLLPQVRYVPGLFSLGIWSAQVYFFLRSPRNYYKSMWQLLSQPIPNISSIFMRIFIFLKSIWLAKELEKTSVSMIHTHFAWLSAGASMIVSINLGIPYTVTTHAYDIFSYKNDLLRITSQTADQIVTISEFNKSAILEKISTLKHDKIKVIHCGIDLSYFQASQNKMNGEIFRIISVGSLVEKKGHEYLIRACSKLRDEGFKYQCVIVGEGELRQGLQALIDDLKLKDQVVLAGSQTQIWVRDQLCKSDLFVLACVTTGSGNRDGIPVAIMEALSMHVPVVSTSLSGIPELIRHEETGLLVPEMDVAALATEIRSLINNSDLRKKYAENGRELIKQEYDILKNTTQLADVFKQVISQHKL